MNWTEDQFAAALCTTSRAGGCVGIAKSEHDLRSDQQDFRPAIKKNAFKLMGIIKG
jgi:hypothetical protein